MSNVISAVARRGRESLVQWRSRYDRSEYPSKVLLNLFYTVAPLDCIWAGILSAYGRQLFPATSEGFWAAKQEVADEYHRAQKREVLPTLERRLTEGIVVGECESRRYFDTVRKAAAGSNADVEELEFTYIYYDVIVTLIIDWAALGRTGVSPDQAFEWVTETSVGGIEYHSLRSVMTGMNIGVSCALDSGGAYRPMPPLW